MSDLLALRILIENYREQDDYDCIDVKLFLADKIAHLVWWHMETLQAPLVRYLRSMEDEYVEITDWHFVEEAVGLGLIDIISIDGKHFGTLRGKIATTLVGLDVVDAIDDAEYDVQPGDIEQDATIDYMIEDYGEKEAAAMLEKMGGPGEFIDGKWHWRPKT